MAKVKSNTPAKPEGKLIKSINVDSHLTKFQVGDNLKSDTLDRYRKAVLESHHVCVLAGFDHAKAMIFCGVTLLEVKDFVGHGRFKHWIDSNFTAETGLSLRTCQRYMRMARLFLKFLANQGVELDTNASITSYLEGELYLAFCALNGETRNLQQSDENWRTPSHILSAARLTLGSIDCDPCAAPDYSTVDEGGISFDARSDGLKSESKWKGNVFIAPGVRADIVPWLEKANREIAQGNINAAIVLTAANFPTTVVKHLQGSPICLLGEALTVTSAAKGEFTQAKLSQPFAVIFLAKQPDVQRFFSHFQTLGPVFVPFTDSNDSQAMGSQIVTDICTGSASAQIDIRNT